MTKISLPEAVDFRWSERLNWFSDKFYFKTSWASGRRISCGGYRNQHPFVSFALKGRFDVDTSKSEFHEYASIKKSPHIGSCSGTLDVMLAVQCAHELAHAAQCTAWLSSLAITTTVTGRSLMKTHGEGWKEVYRYLRVNWVNQMPSYELLKYDSQQF